MFETIKKHKKAIFILAFFLVVLAMVGLGIFIYYNSLKPKATKESTKKTEKEVIKSIEIKSEPIVLPVTSKATPQLASPAPEGAPLPPPLPDLPKPKGGE